MRIFQKFALVRIANSLEDIADALHKQNNILKENMANINETLVNMNNRLIEAKAELLALIEKLRSEELTDEGRAALASAEAIANALADVVPNQEPPPPTP